MKMTAHSNPIMKIVNRSDNQPLEIPEMEMVVAEYIRTRKGVVVHVDIMSKISINDPFQNQKYIDQVNKLFVGFGHAKAYFKQNPYTL